jgi:two-component system response regulator CpxR
MAAQTGQRDRESMTDRTLRILVADDDAMARLGYRALLESAGHRVLLAQDGEEATHLIEKGGIDILLLDVLMPRKEGLETLREVKQRFPQLAVIVMTAGCTRNEFDFLTIASKLGADRTLHKPFNQHDLVGLIEDLKSPAARGI